MFPKKFQFKLPMSINILFVLILYKHYWLYAIKRYKRLVPERGMSKS